MPRATHSLSEPDYAALCRLVDEASGIQIPGSRRTEFERAAVRALEQTGSRDFPELCNLLRDPVRGREALEQFLQSLTIGETHFFRNRPQFEALERHIIPELIAKRKQTRRLRIWSAGCSTGEEPYSLAMLVHRLLPDRTGWNILILATDINKDSLEKARRGRYGGWSFREVPKHLQVNYFRKDGNETEVVPHIREMVTFRPFNLVTGAYPAAATDTADVDLLVCRNVLIYFAEATWRSVVDRFHAALADDGWLVVGHSEPSVDIFHRFTVENYPGTVVYRKNKRSEPPAAAYFAAGASAPTAPPAQVVWSFLQQPVLAAAPITAAPATSAQRLAAPKPEPAPQKAASAPASAASAPASAASAYDELLRVLQAGHVDDALRRAEELAEAHPAEARFPYLAAKIYAGRLQLDKAEVHVRTALKRDPLSAPAHYLLGLILKESDRTEEAVAALRSCVYANADFVLGHFALAGLMARQGQRKRADKILDNVGRLLSDKPADELIPEGDGLTAGRLRELAAIQRKL